MGNTAYALPPSTLKSWAKAEEDYAGGSLSVYWDSIHDEVAEPRPILTYNTKLWRKHFSTRDNDHDHNFAFKGEVMRTTFHHLHYPDVKTFLLQNRAVKVLHNDDKASLFFAGSWVKWGFDHNGGIINGWDAASSVGARPNETTFFATGRKYDDYPGWEQECKKSEEGYFCAGIRRSFSGVARIYFFAGK